MRCQLCESETGRLHLAREMMFGTRETFSYFECSGCGALQIADVPADLARHYSGDYLSFRTRAPRLGDRARKLVMRLRGEYYFTGAGFVGMLLTRLRGPPYHGPWLKNLGARFDSRILDVGSGVGLILRAMRDCGFRELTGLDPYVPAPVDEPGLRIIRAPLADLQETFDVIMLHHSLEHMPDQLATMQAVRRLLRPGGAVLVRIPVVAWAWRTYGTDWIQLDAPRHLVIHTARSMGLLAEKAGFETYRVDYDSSGFQLWGSEQYRRNVPYNETLALASDHRHPLFTKGEMTGFREKARALNAAGDGDQACFYLRAAGARS